MSCIYHKNCKRNKDCLSHKKCAEVTTIKAVYYFLGIRKELPKI